MILKFFINLANDFINIPARVIFLIDKLFGSNVIIAPFIENSLIGKMLKFISSLVVNAGLFYFINDHIVTKLYLIDSILQLGYMTWSNYINYTLQKTALFTLIQFVITFLC